MLPWEALEAEGGRYFVEATQFNYEGFDKQFLADKIAKIKKDKIVQLLVVLQTRGAKVSEMLKSISIDYQSTFSTSQK